MNNIADFEIVRDDHWYRIPVSSQKKWLEQRWPPEWLAFYQTKTFGVERPRGLLLPQTIKTLSQAMTASKTMTEPSIPRSLTLRRANPAADVSATAVAVLEQEIEIVEH
ncbi:MAG: hypothetical protein JW934_19470 [Anaerolineae bacterium]|nr:hypothetical protein [Anaerolineae bacterium]